MKHKQIKTEKYQNDDVGDAVTSQPAYYSLGFENVFHSPVVAGNASFSSILTTPKIEERSVVSSGRWIIGGSLSSPMRPSPDDSSVFGDRSRNDDLFKTPEFLKQRPHKSLLHTPSPLCPQQPYTKFRFSGSSLGDCLISIDSTTQGERLLTSESTSSSYGSGENDDVGLYSIGRRNLQTTTTANTRIQLIGDESLENSFLTATSTPFRTDGTPPSRKKMSRRKRRVPLKKKKIVPRTPTPFKKAYAAAERKGGRIEPVDLSRSPQLLDDLHEIIQNETGSAVASLSATVDGQVIRATCLNLPPTASVSAAGRSNNNSVEGEALVKKSISSLVTNPCQMSAEWLDVTCGRTPVQLEITEKAKRLLGLM